jgi:hypothetical protein
MLSLLTHSITNCTRVRFNIIDIWCTIQFNVIFVIFKAFSKILTFKIISGVMVSVLTLSAVECGVKPETMKLVFYASPLSTQHSGKRAKTCWFRIRIVCSIRVTCLLTDCLISEQALRKSNLACWSSTRRLWSSSQRYTTCSRHDMSKILLTWH